ncbi:MAG TPA: HAD family hydrolase [Gaiellaceae bacterium]|nr:HAD family hydrolase [Gaiellaceae bacterium]
MTAPARHVDLNHLGTEWRAAFASAGQALSAGADCPGSHLPADEVHARTARLARERNSVETLLEAAAHEDHVRFLRNVNVPLTTNAAVGLPSGIDGCIFDLDGVLTTSDDVHFAAWTDTLDAFLARRFERASVHFSHYARLSRRADYDEYLAGRPRIDGVRAFLASRGITLPDGRADDPPGSETVYGLANAKSVALSQRLDQEGVTAFTGAARYLDTATHAGLPCVVASASTNTATILARSGLADLVDVAVDGTAMRELGLPAKPAPDMVRAACGWLGIEPSRAAAFETTPAGITAARTAGCGVVIAVDRTGDAAALLAAGADEVVTDLGALLRVSADRAPRTRR